MSQLTCTMVKRGFLRRQDSEGEVSQEKVTVFNEDIRFRFRKELQLP